MNWNLNNHKIKDNKKETLFSELYSLLSSGLDFSCSFRLLIEGENDRYLRSVLTDLYESVIRGNTLWKSFAAGGHFSSLDSGVIRIGEETGRIGESLCFLADYYHKRIEQKRMVAGAVSYPAIILVTAILVLIFMMLVIVPMFEQVYARMGGELPALTRWMIRLSKNFPLCLIVGSGMLSGVLLLWVAYGKTPRGRAFTARTVLGIPLVGNLIRKNYQARFCKLLYLLYSSGVPLLRSIEMLKEIIAFYPYRCSFETVGEGLKKGEALADKLGEFTDLYDRKLLTLIKVGEETNRLADMLARQGDDLTRELEHRLKQLGSLMEPFLILGVGTLVALVLVSMYLPMFKLGSIMG